MNERRNDLEIVMNRAIVLRDPTRIDLLFTMSEIPHADPCSGSACEVMFSRTNCLDTSVRHRPGFALASFAAAAFATIRLAEP